MQHDCVKTVYSVTMMVGLESKQPVSTSLCRKNIYPEPEDQEEVCTEQVSSSGVESESGCSSGTNSVDKRVTFNDERKCFEALKAVRSAAASKDKEIVRLNLKSRSLDDVICVIKKDTMKIDETMEVLAPSAGNLSIISSEGNGEAVSGQESCNGKLGEEKQSDDILENGSDAQNIVVPSVESWSTNNEVVERLLVAKESRSPDKFVKELVNVEGYEDDPFPWGAAVEVENRDFYPTASTRPLKDDEYQKFLEESEDEESGSESRVFKTCIESSSGNTTLSSQVEELPHDDDVPVINPPETVSNGPETVHLKEFPPEDKSKELAIADPEGNQPEDKFKEFAVVVSHVDPEENQPADESKQLTITEPEVNTCEKIPTELVNSEPKQNASKSMSAELVNPEPDENAPKSIPTELVNIESEESTPESTTSELFIVEPGGSLPEDKLKDLAIIEPEENLLENVPTKLGIVDLNLEENPPINDGCVPTDSVHHEASGNVLLNTEFSRLEVEEISDDFILDVFINDGGGDPSLDDDLNMEFGNAIESASPANDGLDATDDSALQEDESTAEAASCLNPDTKINAGQGHENDSVPCIAPTNEETSEHSSAHDELVMKNETEDDTPAEKSLENIDSLKGSPMSSVSSNRGSVRDPRLRRRTRSFEDSASQVSVASTSSSHSSVRPCSVVLTRLGASPSQSPVQSKTKPVDITSSSGKSNSLSAEESVEHEKSKGEPEVDGCDDKSEKKPVVASTSKSKKSSGKATRLTRRSVPCTSNANSSVQGDVNMGAEPIRLYEPINLDEPCDAVEDEVVSNETEIEAAPDVSSEPVRLTRKRKSSAKSAETVVKKICPSPGNRESTEKPGKLLTSMSKREIVAYIKKESKKDKPDFTKLSEAMNITYDPTRKSMYDNGQVDVEIIKKKHPELLHYQMVKDELGRILKDPTKMVRLEKELSEDVLSCALEGKKKTSFPSKKRHALWQKTIKLWSENKGSQHSTQYQRVLGILAVCFEFADNAVVNKLCTILKQNGTLSKSDLEKMDTPTIVVNESEIFSVVEEADIWIYVDGEKYIKVPNMYEAVLSVFAAYYIFNITYDKSLKSLFEFFDYLCDNRQSTYKAAAKKWPPVLRNGVKEFPVLDP